MPGRGSMVRQRLQPTCGTPTSRPSTIWAKPAGDATWRLEWLPGEDLARVVTRHGPLPADEALAAVLQAAKGLRTAHTQGIGHSDLHAGQLYRLPDGTVKVTGLVLAGNPEDAFDPQTDIAALGHMLKFLLTGRAEMVGSNGGPLAQDLAPAALAAVLARLMSANPATRFGNMAEVVDALQDVERVGDSRLHRPARRPRLRLAVGVGAVLTCMRGWDLLGRVARSHSGPTHPLRVGPCYARRRNSSSS